jgi:hypothetical protein
LQRRSSIAFHDPLAAAVLFDEEICQFAHDFSLF